MGPASIDISNHSAFNHPIDPLILFIFGNMEQITYY